ncbi:MAG: hydrogenase maturation nickel metallochaperone HypA [bacterium]|jgi:hydrogenase nickel incorporation protein HypA/HybF
MHEFSLMENIVSHVKSAAAENGIAKVARFTVVVGAVSGVNIEALRFAFDMHQKAGDLLEALMVIEQKPAPAVCRECGAPFETRDYWPVCPKCGSLNVRVDGGNEFYLSEVEGE